MEQKKLEREAKIAQEKAEREAKRAAEKLEREQKKAAEKAEKEAAKGSNNTNKSVAKVETKVETNVETNVKTNVEAPPAAAAKVSVTRIKIAGKPYLKSSNNILYNPETKEEVGLWDPESKTIKDLPEDDEEEEEEGYEST